MDEITMRPDVSEKMTQALNETMLNNNIDPGAFRTPKYFVYLYSISQEEFERRMPPHLPRLILKACPADQEYVQVAKIAEPFEQADRDIDTGEVRMRFHDAKKIAQDIVCPDAPNMDAAVPAEVMSSGTDLRAKGLFWSLNNPPTAAEVAKAKTRLENYYRSLLERATALEYTNPKELNERLNKDYHLAADYFGEEYSWHKVRVKKITPAAKVECPFCGEQIKSGVAFHGVGDELCILDWERAFAAGKVSKKQYEDRPRDIPQHA